MAIWFIVFAGIIFSLILFLTRSKVKFQPFRFAEFHLNPNSISPKSTFLFLGLINIIILIGTSVFWRHYKAYNDTFNIKAPIWLRFGLNQFNLATENVLAVWYSSMLMLFTSMACLACFLLEKRTLSNKSSRILSCGWLFLSALFLGLSADEMGSWHESFLMIDFNRFLPMSSMNALTIPIAVVGILMSAFFWLHLRTKKASFTLMIIGLLLYLSNPFLERTEHTLAAKGLTQLDSLLWLEEGGEIFGSLSFLVATLAYLTSLKSITFKIRLSRLVVPIIVVGTLISVLFWAVNIYPNYFPRGDVGIAQNWFPAALFMISALLAFGYLMKKRSLTHLTAALFPLINSMYYGSNIPGWIYNLDRLKVIAHSLLICLAILTIILLARKTNTLKYWGICSIWLVFYTYTLKISPPYSQFTDVLSAFFFLLLSLPLLKKDTALTPNANFP